METYCDKCKKNAGSKNFIAKITKQNRLIFLSNCVVCSKK